MKKLIKHFTENKKALLLIDSIGALMTAFLSFFVVRQFSEYFGMPAKALTWLSVIALLFCIYSAACFLLIKGNPAPFIRFIGFANLVYCALTIGLLINITLLLQ